MEEASSDKGQEKDKNRLNYTWVDHPMVDHLDDCTCQEHEPLVLLTWNGLLVGNQEGTGHRDTQDELEQAEKPFEERAQTVVVQAYC